ncbi:MAG: putative manganese-dependent inorganic diphosphatase [Lachnospiraceae bacterium]|nr:putative manganese-dependent inorganic diphosphatase [Lachnospiraceae bacterium]
MKSTYIIGHKNPDTDSICSALAYANLKNEISEEKCYKAKRLGEVNPETKYVLDYFGVKEPELLTDIYPRMVDIPLHTVEPIDAKTSLKKAWDMMREQSIVTLPILEKDGTLKGIITASDITYSDMDVYDNKVLSKAKTPYSNIVETLDGELVVGDMNSCIDSGKVLVSAANPDLMEKFIDPGDVVIIGNRYDSQFCSIEAGARLLIVCMGAEVSNTIMSLAKEKHCDIITTPHDTFIASRLISHSLPCEYFMTPEEKISCIYQSELIESVQNIMTKSRFRYYPVLNTNNQFEGFASRRRLLEFDRRKVILVDHNEASQAVDGLEEGNILEIIDHHKLGNLETMGPIYFRNQPVGCTATIITQLYHENGVEITKPIAGLLVSAILSDTLMFRSPTCTPVDKATAEMLANIAEINIEQYATDMFTAGSDLKGKTAAEICSQDFKKFNAGEIQFGVGQINSMSSDELKEIKDTVLPYLSTLVSEQKLNMVFFMMTNIIEESTYLIMAGENCEEVVTTAFATEVNESEAFLPGVVSRKKQLIPNLLVAFQKLA